MFKRPRSRFWERSGDTLYLSEKSIISEAGLKQYGSGALTAGIEDREHKRNSRFGVQLRKTVER